MLKSGRTKNLSLLVVADELALAARVVAVAGLQDARGSDPPRPRGPKCWPRSRRPKSPTACLAARSPRSRRRTPCCARSDRRGLRPLLVAERARSASCRSGSIARPSPGCGRSSSPCRWKAFVPLFVIALMPPPVNPPWRTSYGDTTSWIFLDGVEADRLRCPSVRPACPTSARPKRSLLTAPSICMLL